jgi:hypothetical protein
LQLHVLKKLLQLCLTLLWVLGSLLRHAVCNQGVNVECHMPASVEAYQPPSLHKWETISHEQGVWLLGLLSAGSTGQQWQVEMGWPDIH